MRQILRSSPCIVAALGALLLGCSDASAPVLPDRLIAVTGEAIRSQVGGRESIALRVTDRGGRPLRDVVVTWTVEAGGGSVTPQSSRTNASGEAVTSWSLGPRPGGQTLSARVSAVPPLVFTADALAGPPASMTAHVEVLERAVVGSAVSPAPAIVVRDAFGNAVAGVAVMFTVTGGGGSVAGAEPTTDAAGMATVGSWNVGTTAGPNTLAAAVGGIAPVVFTTTAVAGAPATLSVSNGAGQQARVGTPVSVTPSVVVRDQHGNGVPGVAVTFAVTGGGGSIAGAQQITSAFGIATLESWTLGTAAGSNTMTASVAGISPIVITATGVPAAPASLAVTGDAQQAAVATAVATAPGVIVRDQYQNPVPGVGVTFSVRSGGGSIAGAQQVTNQAGVATVASWTLGAAAGPNTLSVTANGIGPAIITAIGTVGAPSNLRVSAGDGQTAIAGTAVAIAPAVLVMDQYGNGIGNVAVQFAVASGGGSVTGAQQMTSAAGVAGVGSWTLGAPGLNTLRATVSGLPPLVIEASAQDPANAFNMSIDAVHLNQANQTLHGSIGGVSGRPGLLRVVVRAKEPNVHAPRVRVRLYQGTTLIREALLAAPRTGVPVEPNLADPSHTWNLPLTASDVVPGLSVEAVLDPEETIPVATRADNRFPREAGTASLNVTTLAPLRIVFIPIHATRHGRTGAITSANVDAYLQATRQWIPHNAISTVVRAPYTTGLDLSTTAAWSTLLSEIQAVRTAEAAVDQYYHGIIGSFPGIAYGGLGYVPPSPGSRYRSGLSHDALPGASATIAHELGHNLGRPHAPCGSPSGADPNYPHANATLGSPGFDILAGSLQSASNLRDYMSYCSPRWTSDYTYGGIVQWRRQDPLAQPAATAFAGSADGPTSGVLVWGSIHAGGVTLNPAFAFDGAPVLPETPGPNELRGTAMDGRELFRFSFDGVPVADGPSADERHFAFFVPLGAAALDALARIEISTPAGAAVLSTSPAAAADVRAAGEPLLVERAVGARLRIRWDAARHPMAMVRDARTGQILSFARHGDTVVSTPAPGSAAVEVILSDGVRSRIADRR